MLNLKPQYLLTCLCLSATLSTLNRDKTTLKAMFNSQCIFTSDLRLNHHFKMAVFFFLLHQSDKKPSIPQSDHDPTRVFPHVYQRNILCGQRETLPAVQPPVRGFRVLQRRQDFQGKAAHTHTHTQIGLIRVHLNESDAHNCLDRSNKILSVAEIVPQGAAHPSGVEGGAGRRLSALFPECRPCGGLHQRGLHGGGHR